MSVVYGLTSVGFVPKSLEVIREDMNNALRAAFGLSIKLGDKSIFGQIVGIIAALLAELWEQLEAVYSAGDPRKARGAALEAVSAITGTYRPPASFSTVPATLLGTPGTLVPAGTRFAVDDTDQKFATNADATLVAIADWQASHAYVLGDRVFSDTERVYQCTVAGTSHASTPVAGTGPDILDNNVHWRNIAENQTSPCGVADATALATVTGPIEAAAGTMKTIDTAVFGLTTVVNLVDASKGRHAASDEELYSLREQELAGQGKSPADSLRAKLLKVPGILSCSVLENLTDTTNADGMPPHSVECLIRTQWAADPDDDQVVFNAIQANIAAGIPTHGTVTGSALDSEGQTQVIKFSRPEEKLIYVQVNVTVDAELYPDDGDELIKDAIVDWGDLQSTDNDARSRAIGARAFGVSGVLDAEALIDIVPSPTLTTAIAVSKRQIAVYDHSRIDVVATPGEP